MGQNIPLGRFAGIKVSMSWMVPVVGLFYAVTLAENRLPIEVSGQSHSSYWVAGVVGAVLFFASLLAHEVGHALMARREGIGVEGIALWLLGGVATFENEPETAGASLRVAAIGPLTSAAVGVVFVGCSQLLSGGLGMLALYGHMFGWLGFINLLLAAFNLLPGPPLDGGVVLGALLWMQTRDQTSAQRAASRFGQVLGGALLALGGYLAGSEGNQDGFLLLGIGAFILFSATSQHRATAGLGILRSIKLAEVMDPDPPVLPEWMTVHDLVTNAPAYLPHTAFAVRGVNGFLSGLITAEAVQATDPRLWPTLRLSDLAFPVDRLQVGSVDDSVLVTMQRARNGVTGRVLVVTADGRVAGMVGPDLTARAAAAYNHRHEPRAVAPPPTGPWQGGTPAAVGPPSGAPPTAWPGR